MADKYRIFWLFHLWQKTLARLMDRERIERQLTLAEQKRAAWEKQLDSDKVASDQRKRNTKWRQLDADVRALKRRILAVKSIEEREAIALAKKAESTAGVAE